MESAMKKRSYLFAVAVALIFGSGASAQYPVLDMVANKVIQKYQSATCEQLWQERAAKKPQSEQEKNLVQILHDEPEMRAAFLDKVAAPVVNKMFECGMIP
jgi:hypothetical protein